MLTDDAVRDGHLWTSSDGGSTWMVHDISIESPDTPWLANTNLDQFMSAGRLMFDPQVPGRVWFAEGMAVWATDDFDEPEIVWRSTALGIDETVVSGIAVQPDGTVIATVADRQGFRLTTARTFPTATLIDERFASGSSASFSVGDPQVVAWVGAESHLAFSADRGERGAVSVDGGLNWREMTGLVDDMYGGEVAVSATDPATIVWLPTHHESPAAYLDDPAGLYVSHDQGTSWQRIDVDGSVDSFHRFFWWFTRRALAADTVDGSFYLMSDEARFYVSDDGARTWVEAPHAPPCVEADDCHVAGQVHSVPGVAGHLWAAVGSGGLYRTADAGRTPWIEVDGVAEAVAISFGAPVPPSADPTVFLFGRLDGSPDRAVWRSDDLGATWALVARFPYDLANRINAIAGDPSTPGQVYVGFGGNGVVVGAPV